ncbi:hypothetical protein H4R24_001115 [Coemansia sp. RSA 988]|nr:hypothetical protein H4R24_001115 [Coemansia sp. RSA 988]
MYSQTPPRRAQGTASPSTLPKTPIAQVLHNVERLTPQSNATPTKGASPFSSPALLRMDQGALRTRLREAYGLLKEKEKNLFLAATVGQELVEANQQLQDGYEAVERELAIAQQKLKHLSEPPLQNERESDDDDQAARLYGRRRSMHLQHVSEKATQPSDSGASSKSADIPNDCEKQWIKIHVQPIKAQLMLAQEHTDELLVEREELGTQVFQLRQELSAALRRANESSTSAIETHKHLGQLEEENARLHGEIDKQRTLWSRRWAEHQQECKATQMVSDDGHRGADSHTEDVAARLQAEQRADELQMQHSAMQTENELLRSRIQRTDEERTEEWEPMRARWLSCEEALQELQETHQCTCEALAQAEARLAELDKGSRLEDPIKLKSQKTSTSLLGELDLQRHNAVSQQRMLAREHAALKRAYGRAINSQSRMKQQVARLTQLAASGASEARMKRLEAALGEAECQQQALLWASMEQRRPADMGTDSDIVSSTSEHNGTALVTALRARLKQVFVDRDQAQRELRTAHLLRANEIQRTRELEREAADAEAKLCQVVGELTSLRADNESLRRVVKASKRYQPKPHPTNELPSELSATQDNNSNCDLEGSILPRKRTRSGAQPTGDGPHQQLSGPTSLSFVVNTGSTTQDYTEPPSSFGGFQGSAADPQRSAKRLQLQASSTKEVDSSEPSKSSDIDNSNGGTGISEGTTIPSYRSTSFSQVNDAADHGMRSWLDNLGADAATSSVQSAADISRMSENTGATAVIDIANAHGHSKVSTMRTSQDQRTTTVDEIHIGSKTGQRPMECNNQ